MFHNCIQYIPMKTPWYNTSLHKTSRNSQWDVSSLPSKNTMFSHGLHGSPKIHASHLELRGSKGTVWNSSRSRGLRCIRPFRLPPGSSRARSRGARGRCGAMAWIRRIRRGEPRGWKKVKQLVTLGGSNM
jgi:hypothetical protein